MTRVRYVRWQDGEMWLGYIGAERITIEPGKRSGQLCIRGPRITVWDVLDCLASGKSEEQLLDDYPELEKEDFKAVYAYASRLGRRVAL